MVIIWRGLGWLVPVIAFGVSFAANLLFNAVYGDGYYDNHKWPLAISLLISAAACWFIGRALKMRSDRVVIDKRTGEQLVLDQSRHTLFFIPMHLWGLILAFIALVILAVEFAHR